MRIRIRKWTSRSRFLHKLVQFLVQRGVRVSETARPAVDTHEAHATYIRLLRAATSRAQTLEGFQRNLEILKTLAPDDDRYYARMIRGNTHHHIQWLDTDEIRHRMRYKCEFFDDYGFLLCPVASSAAQPHDFSGERYQRTVTINGHKVSYDASALLGRDPNASRATGNGGTDRIDPGRPACGRADYRARLFRSGAYRLRRIDPKRVLRVHAAAGVQELIGARAAQKASDPSVSAMEVRRPDGAAFVSST